MQLRPGLVAILLVAVAACSGSTEAPSDTGSREEDASVREDARVREDAETGGDASVDSLVEIGTGETSFVPLAENQVVELIRGPQGGSRYYGFHIWVSLRTIGFNPQEISARFTTKLGTMMLSEAAYRLNLEPDGEARVAVGLRQILSDCCLVENQPLTLRVEVTDTDGLTGADQRVVISPAECPRGLPNPTIDPCP